jgi:hypothetical protein
VHNQINIQKLIYIINVMEPYDLDFEVFNTPGDSFLNVHPEPYMQADFSGFEDLKYFQNEIFHPNEQV